MNDLLVVPALDYGNQLMKPEPPVRIREEVLRKVRGLEP